ncbi:MAG: hypothetical protein AAGA03_18030 [Planctomycetota bacterium]
MKRIQKSVRDEHGNNLEKIIQFYIDHAERLSVNSEGEFVVV